MIILDVETTGISPEKNSIVSIGAIDFAHPEKQFFEECKIWDQAEINPTALQINGFTEAQIKDPRKKGEGEIAKLFIDWLENRDDMVIAGQNVSFDVSMINSALLRVGISSPLSARIVDLHSVTYFHMIRRGIEPPILNRKTRIDSDKIMEYVGINAEPKPHMAINGAIWEAEAFSRMMHNKILFKQFESFPIPWTQNT